MGAVSIRHPSMDPKENFVRVGILMWALKKNIQNSEFCQNLNKWWEMGVENFGRKAP